MKLLVLHPALTRFSCAECQEFSYDFDTGERDTFLGPCGTRLDVVRCVPPPCEKCPKQGPEHEHEHLLSRKNLQTLILYRQVRASGGRCLTDHERQDAVLSYNLAVVDCVVKECERIVERRERRDQLRELVELARML